VNGFCFGSRFCEEGKNAESEVLGACACASRR
jgi:hypothetical protein